MVTKEKRASIIENMDPTIINKAHKFINYGAILILIFSILIFIFDSNFITDIIGPNFIGNIAHNPLIYIIICTVFLLDQKFGKKLRILNNILSLFVGFIGVLAIFSFFNISEINYFLFSVTNNSLYLAYYFIIYSIMLLCIVNRKWLGLSQFLPLINIAVAVIGILNCLAFPDPNWGIILNFAVFKVILSGLLFNANPYQGFIWIFYLDTPGSQFIRYGIFVVPLIFFIPVALIMYYFTPTLLVDSYVAVATIAMLIILIMLIFYSWRVERYDLENVLSFNENEENRKFYESLIQNMSGGVLATDSEDNIIYINKAFSTYFGLNEKILTNTPFFDGQWYFSILFDEYAEAKSSKKPVFIEYKEIMHYAGVRYISGWITPIIIDDTFKGMIFTLIDVSSQEGSTLSAALDDKNVLLGEVHDRVKNNMQIILSLLNIQSHESQNDEIKEAILESQQRINTMALVHEKLYQNLDFSQVNVIKYVDELIKEVCKNFSKNDNISFDKDILNSNFSIGTTISLGLILNELLTNCGKYAFPNGKEGLVKIKLRKNKANLNEYYFEIKDNGVGFLNNDIDEHMGIKIVKEMASQLNGVVNIYSSNHGVLVNIIFRPDEEKMDKY
ncbi:sensor histidine kinase [Methanobrevibacter acididurans]|uniref:sensor histidine kinase n=1 Tax=Methanobrevibacter acididurans TaxID=120963 RepID=UPI0038FCF759